MHKGNRLGGLLAVFLVGWQEQSDSVQDLSPEAQGVEAEDHAGEDKGPVQLQSDPRPWVTAYWINSALEEIFKADIMRYL